MNTYKSYFMSYLLSIFFVVFLASVFTIFLQHRLYSHYYGPHTAAKMQTEDTISETKEELAHVSTATLGVNESADKTDNIQEQLKTTNRMQAKLFAVQQNPVSVSPTKQSQNVTNRQIKDFIRKTIKTTENTPTKISTNTVSSDHRRTTKMVTIKQVDTNETYQNNVSETYNELHKTYVHHGSSNSEKSPKIVTEQILRLNVTNEETELPGAQLDKKRVKLNSVEVDHRYVKMLGCRKLPDLLIIGFEKCGTVTLKSFLGIHPQIFVPSLHQNYQLFNKGNALNVLAYTRHQRCTPSGKLRLEKLSTWGTASKTYKIIPKVKLIAIVREPVERSMSHFVHRLSLGKETKPYDFDKQIASIMDKNVPVKLTASVLFRQSQYIDRLDPWVKKYGINNIHFVDGDHFARNPVPELQKLEQLLGLEAYISQDNFIYNPQKRFYCLRENGKAACMSNNKGRPHESMSNMTRTRLQKYYHPYNERLFKTIGYRFQWNY